ncbi:hypothetical protein QPK31_02115 [Massilia sp. YIM B02769]|nr:hypothetical protein [Massilia sp. YIM B02769]
MPTVFTDGLEEIQDKGCYFCHLVSLAMNAGRGCASYNNQQRTRIIACSLCNCNCVPENCANKRAGWHRLQHKFLAATHKTRPPVRLTGYYCHQANFAGA